MNTAKSSSSVIPAKAGIQRFYPTCIWGLSPMLRGRFYMGLDSRLRGNDEFVEVSAC